MVFEVKPNSIKSISFEYLTTIPLISIDTTENKFDKSMDKAEKTDTKTSEKADKAEFSLPEINIFVVCEIFLLADLDDKIVLYDLKNYKSAVIFTKNSLNTTTNNNTKKISVLNFYNEIINRNSVSIVCRSCIFCSKNNDIYYFALDDDYFTSSVEEIIIYKIQFLPSKVQDIKVIIIKTYINP